MYALRRVAGTRPGPVELRALGARSILLLEAIEETIGAVNSDVGMLRSLNSALEEATEELQQAPRAEAVDADGARLDMFETAKRAAQHLAKTYIRKRDAAAHAEELHADDGVVECYEDALEAVHETHAALVGIMDAIVSHDSRFRETVSAEDFFASLGE